jgi:hypothetical protein
MNTVFVYEKKNDLLFFNLDKALENEQSLKSMGWKHVASIDPAIAMTKIFDICSEEYGADERISDIISFFKEVAF